MKVDIIGNINGDNVFSKKGIEAEEAHKFMNGLVKSGALGMPFACKWPDGTEFFATPNCPVAFWTKESE